VMESEMKGSQKQGKEVRETTAASLNGSISKSGRALYIALKPHFSRQTIFVG
jgi:hypothetical protein